MREYASKRKIVILTGVVLVAITGVLINVNIPKQDLSKETNQSTNSGKTLAVYIEEDGGEYRASSDGKFPKDGYILDTEKSTCENGGVLSQDPATKKISLRVGHKTKCSLYFKKDSVQLVPVIAGLKANPESITDYNSGNKAEMYTFSHDATAQTEALTDYRYIGNVPNNYIQFNNETWRIIGVFIVEGENGEKEQRIKIIRDESIGNFTWDKKADGTYTNEWPTSSLSTMLNGDYVNKGGSFTYSWYNYGGTANNSTIQGLNSTAKSQIASTKWYLGGSKEYENLGGPDYYNFERGTTVYTGRGTNWIANVGLMYPSDYVYTYANGVDNRCYTDGYKCNNGTPSASWLFNSATQWTITPHSFYSNYAYFVSGAGSVNYSSVNYSPGVRPVVYLRSDIEITSGTGTENDPYILKS